MSRLFDDNQDLKNIYHKMLEWLSQSELSEKRLADRIVRLKRLYPETLRYRGYTRENAERVIRELRREGFVDDRKYAKRLFELLKDKRDGLRAIRRKMIARGIPLKLVDSTIASFQKEGHMQDMDGIMPLARRQADRLAKRFGSDPRKRYTIGARLAAWLALRGYTAEERSAILKSIGKK